MSGRRRRVRIRAALPVWVARLELVASALHADAPRTPVTSPDDFERRLVSVVDLTDHGHVWLTLATLTGVLPDDLTVQSLCRETTFEGTVSFVDALLDGSTTDSLAAPVRIASDAVLVDVQHTAGTDLSTGIQRVARETARRWHGTHDCELVGWTEGFTALRTLSTVEHRRMVPTPDGPGPETIVVPWRSTYLVPELAADPPRTRRLLALARHSTNVTGTIGFDTVPVTSADTSSRGFPGFFANYLAAVRHFDTIATISRAAAAEYGGWRSMLTAVGMPGPRIEPVLLPAEAPAPDPSALARAARRFLVADLPMVLCVGTHEPRKNHLAVLHAAEVLWGEGLRFSLTFVGGHSWNSDLFRSELARLAAAGHPVETASGIDDELLWAAYRLARFTVFPSFNEGFGLPVAESLAAGTPAITSGFGSMAEIAADGGALLVDPRDDRSIITAIRTLLVDEAQLADLTRAAHARPSRTWDEYAEETWALLTRAAVAGTDR